MIYYNIVYYIKYIIILLMQYYNYINFIYYTIIRLIIINIL